MADCLPIMIAPTALIREAIQAIDAGGFGIALVVTADGRLIGTVTDGDIRRGLLRGVELNEVVAKVTNRHPITAHPGSARDDLIRLMTHYAISQVPLVIEGNQLVGIQLLRDLVEQPKEKETPVVIMAGGEGTRLRPYTAEMPKPLIKVGNRPVLELLIEQLRMYGFVNVYLSVNHLKEKIEGFFGDGSRFGVNIRYLCEERRLGTCGSILLAKEKLTVPFFVINGDLLTKVNFDYFLAFHREGRFSFTMGVKQQDLQLPFGVVRLDADRVISLEEKPPQTYLVNAGIYLINPDVISRIPGNTYYDMTNLIQSLLDDGCSLVGAFPIHEYWVDIGTHGELARANADYREHLSKGQRAQ